MTGIWSSCRPLVMGSCMKWKLSTAPLLTGFSFSSWDTKTPWNAANTWPNFCSLTPYKSSFWSCHLIYENTWRRWVDHVIVWNYRVCMTTYMLMVIKPCRDSGGQCGARPRMQVNDWIKRDWVLLKKPSQTQEWKNGLSFLRVFACQPLLSKSSRVY